MGSGRRVLVIDDDRDFSEFIEIVLTAHGYQVRQAATVAAAFECLQADIPDVIIADAMLSYNLGGWGMLTALRAQESLRRVPVLLVSAVVRAGEEALFPQEASLWDRFMRKPISPDELVRVIGALLADKEAACA